MRVTGNADYPLEYMDWIAKLEKLEILKLDIYVCTDSILLYTSILSLFLNPQIRKG